MGRGKEGEGEEGVKEGKGCGRDRFGKGRGEREGEERKGAGMMKRGGEESWNRAAEWLRPALGVCDVEL